MHSGITAGTAADAVCAENNVIRIIIGISVSALSAAGRVMNIKKSAAKPLKEVDVNGLQAIHVSVLTAGHHATVIMRDVRAHILLQ